MSVLVTGASGLIGRSTVRELLGRGYEVRTLHRGGPLPGLESAHVSADTRSADARAAAQEAEAIVHLAGLGDVARSFEQPYEYNEINAQGTLNVLEGARQGGGAVLLASTQRIYALSPRPISEDGALAPLNPYAYSKLIAESYVRQYASLLGVRALNLRFFSVYGPGQQGYGISGVAAIFLERAMAGQPLIVHGRRRRDFTHADDVARGIALALEGDWQPGAAYNIATGVGTSLLELAQTVKELTGSDSEIQEAAQTDTGRDDQAAGASPEGDDDLVGDCTRARMDLGYEHRITLRDGLASWLELRGAHV